MGCQIKAGRRFASSPERALTIALDEAAALERQGIGVMLVAAYERLIITSDRGFDASEREIAD